MNQQTTIEKETNTLNVNLVFAYADHELFDGIYGEAAVLRGFTKLEAITAKADRRKPRFSVVEDPDKDVEGTILYLTDSEFYGIDSFLDRKNWDYHRFQAVVHPVEMTKDPVAGVWVYQLSNHATDKTKRTSINPDFKPTAR